MKKKFFAIVIAITLVMMGGGFLNAPVTANAAVKWQKKMPKQIRGTYRTKKVNNHLHELAIAQNFMSDEYRTYHANKKVTKKLPILLMWRVPARKLSAHLYEVKSITRSGKHVHYYLKTFSHHRLKLSKTQSFAHKAYYHRIKK